MILYYRLMTKWSGLGDSTELSRMGLSHVPQNLAPNQLASVTAEAHRSVDPLWHLDIVLPLHEEVQVQLRT
jgi:hypothetical protein